MDFVFDILQHELITDKRTGLKKIHVQIDLDEDGWEKPGLSLIGDRDQPIDDPRDIRRCA